MNSKNTLSLSLNQNISEIKRIANGSSDVKINQFTTGGIKCALLCCDGMVSTAFMTELIFDPITAIPPQKNADSLFSYIDSRLLLSSDRLQTDSFSDLFRLMNSGFVILLADGKNYALAFGVQGFPSRSIQEPLSEGNIMGSHEGFVETLNVNMSLIRRRIKSPILVMETLVKGDKSCTNLCICYMHDRVPEKLLNDIRRSLDRINTEAILTTGYIRPFVENRRFEIFSSTGTTERPDVLCSKLIEGRVAILIDGIPYAVIIPKLFCESFQTLDDYAYKPYYATFIRWLKYGAFIIAVMLPAVYTAIVMYHPELFNSTLLMILVDSETKAPLSILSEALFVLIMYEIIREAGVRLPKPSGSAVSLISGLIIGDSAVKSGLVSTPLLTMTALAVLGGLAVPELNPQMTILRFAFLISGGIFGLFGISMLFCAVLANICATEDYGFPFTAPFSPFKLSGMSDTAYRTGMKKMQNRNFTVEEYRE